jgi:hypothetical protein
MAINTAISAQAMAMSVKRMSPSAERMAQPKMNEPMAAPTALSNSTGRTDHHELVAL